jgi:hypothetical protein
VDKRKRTLGRDVFKEKPEQKKSQALKKLVENKAPSRSPTAKEVEVTIKLTPSNIKHLEQLVVDLEKKGKGKFTRTELIRVAITLLSTGDF